MPTVLENNLAFFVMRTTDKSDLAEAARLFAFLMHARSGALNLKGK